jgi:biopolymer transport protein ExbB
MNSTNTASRWAVLSRWTFYLAVGAVLASAYLAWRPAGAQEKASASPAADKTAEKTSADKTSSDKTIAEKAAAGEAAAAAALTEGTQAAKYDKARPADSEEKEGLNLIKIVQHGGAHMWAVYPILALSIVAVAMAIERAIGLRRGKIVPRELIAGLKAIAGQKGGFDPRQAAKLCRQYPSSAATVVKAMLQKVGRPLPELEHAVADASDREASRLYANVRWQTLAFNVAPMLGLAGTVHGVILAFYKTAHMAAGQNKMEELATGIYAALICTLAGLVVAIPAGVLAHVFEGRILRLFRQLDDVVLALVPQLERFEGQKRGGKTATAAPAESAAAEALPPEAGDELKAKWPVITPRAQS